MSKSGNPSLEPGQGRHGPIRGSHISHDVHGGLCCFALHRCGQRNLADGISRQYGRTACGNCCKRGAAGKTPGGVWAWPALVISGSKLLRLTDREINVCGRNRNRSGSGIHGVGHMHFCERNVACGVCGLYCDQIDARFKRDVAGKAAPGECDGDSIAG